MKARAHSTTHRMATAPWMRRLATGVGGGLMRGEVEASAFSSGLMADRIGFQVLLRVRPYSDLRLIRGRGRLATRSCVRRMIRSADMPRRTLGRPRHDDERRSASRTRGTL